MVTLTGLHSTAAMIHSRNHSKAIRRTTRTDSRLVRAGKYQDRPPLARIHPLLLIGKGGSILAEDPGAEWDFGWVGMVRIIACEN
jgi:hypothetical protein